MDIKKNPKLQTSTSSNLFFTGGLVVALSLTVFAFEYKTYDKIEIGGVVIEPSPTEVTMLDEIPITTMVKPIAPPPTELAFKPAPEETKDTTTQKEPDKDPKQQTPQGDTTTKVVKKFVLPPPIVEPKDEIMEVVQIKASFPGGSKEYVKFLNDNMKYPNSALRNGREGTVYIKFIVDKDGSIIKDCVKVAKSIDPALDAEAIHVVKMSPKWTPALQNERPVKQRIRVPVKFYIKK